MKKKSDSEVDETPKLWTLKTEWHIKDTLWDNHTDVVHVVFPHFDYRFRSEGNATFRYVHIQFGTIFTIGLLCFCSVRLRLLDKDEFRHRSIKLILLDAKPSNWTIYIPTGVNLSTIVHIHDRLNSNLIIHLDDPNNQKLQPYIENFSSLQKDGIRWPLDQFHTNKHIEAISKCYGDVNSFTEFKLNIEEQPAESLLYHNKYSTNCAVNIDRKNFPMELNIKYNMYISDESQIETSQMRWLQKVHWNRRKHYYERIHSKKDSSSSSELNTSTTSIPKI